MAAANTGLADEVEGVGLVVPPGDAHALAVAVRKLADDGKLRHVLGENARRRAMERWDKTAMFQSLDRDLKALGEHK